MERQYSKTLPLIHLSVNVNRDFPKNQKDRGGTCDNYKIFYHHLGKKFDSKKEV